VTRKLEHVRAAPAVHCAAVLQFARYIEKEPLIIALEMHYSCHDLKVDEV
jgi:hypothetical protein